MDTRARVVVMKAVFLGSVMVVSFGCTKEPENDDKKWQSYVTQYADAQCSLRDACDLNFESTFGGREHCIEVILDQENKRRECRKQNDCEFDPEEGEFCVTAIQELECDEWLAGELDDKCESVWSGCTYPLECTVD
jgi:hypothetical protein